MTADAPPVHSKAIVVASQLEKPDLDDRSYRVIQLPNKLEALLVHDPDTDKASAALDVHVGNFSDSIDLQVSSLDMRNPLFGSCPSIRPSRLVTPDSAIWPCICSQ